MKLTATVAGVAHEIGEPSLSDLVAFERHFGISSTVLDMSDSPDGARSMRLEWLAFLIYRGLVRTGVADRGASFDDVLETVEDFDVIPEDGDDVDPTQDVSEPAAS